MNFLSKVLKSAKVNLNKRLKFNKLTRPSLGLDKLRLHKKQKIIVLGSLIGLGTIVIITAILPSLLNLNNAKASSSTIQFLTSSSAGLEVTSNPSVTVNLSQATTSSTSVNFTVTGGTATGNGADYSLASGSLVIPAGQTVGSVPLKDS